MDHKDIKIEELEEKRCSKCGEVKPVSEFHKNRQCKYGVHSNCKICVSDWHKTWYVKNSEKINAACKKWRMANPEKVRAKGRNWAKANPEKVRAYTKKWRAANPKRAKAMAREREIVNFDKRSQQKKEWKAINSERRKIMDKKWRAENSERVKAVGREWRMKNLEKARAKGRKSSAKRRSTLKGKLGGNMSSNISHSLQRGTKGKNHWENMVDFNIDQLKTHLEKRFTPEMNWENYGTYWHVDHIIPVSVFNFTKPKHIDFKRCWSLKNLQPLEAIANKSKNARIENPFQPSLTLEI